MCASLAAYICSLLFAHMFQLWSNWETVDSNLTRQEVQDCHVGIVFLFGYCFSSKKRTARTGWCRWKSDDWWLFFCMLNYHLESGGTSWALRIVKIETQHWKSDDIVDENIVVFFVFFQNISRWLSAAVCLLNMLVSRVLPCPQAKMDRCCLSAVTGTMTHFCPGWIIHEVP